jgi:uncharacterized protein
MQGTRSLYDKMNRDLTQRKDSNMTSLSLMVKPASSSCNLHCRYCFYHDIATKRETPNMGLMNDETLETMVRKALSHADQFCTFTFQGGEPTLAGLGFYQKFIQLQLLYNKHHTRIINTIQTNGCILDYVWTKFLHDHHFLVGISLDGPAETHNLNRVDDFQNRTFNRVMASARLLAKNQADFNILSVVTGSSARSIEKIYRFFREQGFNYLQFIPCIEPLCTRRGKTRFYLSPEQYGYFLCRLFDLWHADFTNGKYVSIRLFDNLVNMLNGQKPEACNMNGQCSVNLVIEGNGNVYPCDFYCTDQYILGNINQDTIPQLLQSERAQQFIAESRPVPVKCKTCEYYFLCRNGCKRDREWTDNQDYMLHYCESYRQFFTYALARLQRIAATI